MTPSLHGVPNPAGSDLRRTTDDRAPNAIKESRAATRLPASRVPSITAVRLSPHGVEGTLINISTHGVAVECDRRLLPKSQVTVLFDGTFEPSSVASRVARCHVVGLGQDGGLRYQAGIAFDSPIELVEAPTPVAQHPEPQRPDPTSTPSSVVVRNRW